MTFFGKIEKKTANPIWVCCLVFKNYNDLLTEQHIYWFGLFFSLSLKTFLNFSSFGAITKVQ